MTDPRPPNWTFRDVRWDPESMDVVVTIDFTGASSGKREIFCRVGRAALSDAARLIGKNNYDRETAMCLFKRFEQAIKYAFESKVMGGISGQDTVLIDTKDLRSAIEKSS